MGIFDKMFGSGAKAALADLGSQRRFDDLKQKYQPVFRMIEQQNVQVRNLHVQDNKLVIQGTAPSEQAKNRVWDEIKLVNPNYDDIVVDLTAAQAASAAAGSGAGAGKDPDQIRPGEALVIPKTGTK